VFVPNRLHLGLENDGVKSEVVVEPWKAETTLNRSKLGVWRLHTIRLLALSLAVLFR
jgi:hypothetical protein